MCDDPEGRCFMLDELSLAIDQGRLGGHRQGLGTGTCAGPSTGLGPEPGLEAGQGQGSGQEQDRGVTTSDVSFLTFLIQVVTMTD